MKTISKHFASLKEAEKYQSRLINKWDYVQLVQLPLFRENGLYMWNVK